MLRLDIGSKSVFRKTQTNTEFRAVQDVTITVIVLFTYRLSSLCYLRFSIFDLPSSVTPFPLRTRALPHAGVRCTAESGQKAKTALDAAHEEALVLMKDAEELLGKGEMQEAQAHFQSALEK